MDSFERTIYCFIKKFLCHFRIDINDSSINGIIQFLEFLLVGVTTTIVGYVSYVIVIFALRSYETLWDYYAGNVVSFFCGVSWSFYWNNRIVFRIGRGEKRSVFLSLIKTYASYAFTGIILSNLLMYVWINVLMLSKMIAPLLSAVICIPINYLINKLWAFRTNREVED